MRFPRLAVACRLVNLSFSRYHVAEEREASVSGYLHAVEGARMPTLVRGSFLLLVRMTSASTAHTSGCKTSAFCSAARLGGARRRCWYGQTASPRFPCLRVAIGRAERRYTVGGWKTYLSKALPRLHVPLLCSLYTRQKVMDRRVREVLPPPGKCALPRLASLPRPDDLHSGQEPGLTSACPPHRASTPSFQV